MLSRLAIAAALLASATTTTAAPSREAIAFGARERVQSISLSPDGKRVAILTPDARRGTTVMVVTLGSDAEPKAVLSSSGNPDDLHNCEWSTDTRLACRIGVIVDTGFGLGRYSRMVAVNADGGDVKMLTASATERDVGFIWNGGGIIDWTGDRPGTVLMTRQIAPETRIGSAQNVRRDGLAVESVDTRTLARRMVEQPDRETIEYISDGKGQVRIRGEQQASEAGIRNAVTYLYRKPGNRQWDELSRVTYTGGLERGFNPYAVDPALNVAYGFDRENGRLALFRVALDGSLKRELVLANPQVDIDGLIRIGRQQRVVGASWVTDVRTSEFFDPELARLRQSLGRALPDKPQLSFVDTDASETKLLLFAGADTSPGAYYLYDKSTRALGEVIALRPPLAGTKLATVKPVTFPAADGTMIPGYLTLPPAGTGRNLPAIVMPHGGPGARDEWGFDWLAQFFAARGYAVLQPNYRGSAGYGEDWFKENGFKSWRTAIGDVDDGARWMVKQGIADAGKLAIVGWSYGGYAALQAAVVDPTLYKAVVAIAPVTDLERLRTDIKDSSTRAIADGYIGNGPHVRDGSPALHAGQIQVPVLLFHGDLDLNVDVRQSRAMASALRGAGKKVDYVEVKGLDHQLDDSAVRTDMLDRSDNFLRAAMGL